MTTLKDRDRKYGKIGRVPPVAPSKRRIGPQGKAGGRKPKKKSSRV